MFDSNSKWLIHNELREESTNKRISGTIGINNKTGVDQMYGELVNNTILDDDCWISTLGDDNCAGSLAVLLVVKS